MTTQDNGGDNVSYLELTYEKLIKLIVDEKIGKRDDRILKALNSLERRVNILTWSIIGWVTVMFFGQISLMIWLIERNTPLSS